jgi:hypothetical protein
MNAHLVPLRWYRYATDAEGAKHRLQTFGIESVLRRSVQRLEDGSGDAEDAGFDLWVERGVIERARAALRDAEHPGLLCERCRTRTATVHWTGWEGGHQVTRHLCGDCGHGLVE